MPNKRKSNQVDGTHTRTGKYPGETTSNSMVVSGYDNGVPERWNVKAPGFRARVLAHGPPPPGSRASEEQEMQILGMITMPEEFEPVRYSDQFSAEKSCCKAMTQREQCSWQDVPDQNMTNLLLQETFIADFRGCGALWRRFVMHTPNKDLEQNTMYLADCETRSSNVIYLDGGAGPAGSYQLDYNIAVPADGITYKPHGEQLVCGSSKKKYEGARFFSLDGVPNPTASKESKIVFTLTNAVGTPTAATCDGVFFVVRCDGFNYTTYAAIDIAKGATEVEIEVNSWDYYAVFYKDFFEDPATDTTNFPNDRSRGVVVEFTSFCSVLRQVPVKEAYKNFSQLGPGCVRAASLRLTDMAAPLEIQGECSVANTREPNTWMNMYQSAATANSVFKVVSQYRDNYLGPLRLGGYAFHMPHTMDDFNMKPFCTVDYDTGTLIDVWFELEDTSVVNVYSARTLNTGANNGMTGQGADCWVTCVTAWDWTVDNSWPSATFPDIHYSVWMDALEHLRWVPRAMSNKWHIATLMGELFRQGKIVARKYAGPLIRVAGRAVAEHLAGQSPLMDSGIKLLKDAYGIGNEIASTLQGGGQ